jgi:prepilin-type N-terminal cleavage/methylation domain-containing protein
MRIEPSNRDPAAHVRRGQVRAFTLLELLLATAIFSIVLIAINTVFFSALHLRKATIEALEESLPIEHALAVMRKDLQNVVVPGGVLAGHFRSLGPASGLGSTSIGGSSTAGTQSQTPATGTGTALTESAIQGGFDFFTSTGIVRDGLSSSDIQEVNYQLMEPIEGEKAQGQDLVRSVTRNLLSFVTPVPEEQRLLKNVEALEFEFYDGYEWRDTWDTSLSETNLPMAVRMRLLRAAPPQQRNLEREPIELVVILSQAGATPNVSESDTNSVSGGGE